MSSKKLNQRVGLGLCTLILLVVFFAGIKMVWNVKNMPASIPRPPSAQGIPVGTAAPAFALKDLDGKEVSLTDYRGKVVLIDFWATWCPPCLEELPHIQRIHAAYRDSGLVVLAISTDRDKDAVRPFVEKYGYTFPVLFADEKVQAAYGVRSIPTVYLIDQQGKVRFHHVGYSPGSEKTLERQVERLLKNEIDTTAENAQSAVPIVPSGERVSADPAKMMPAKPEMGQWRSYGVADGLPGAEIRVIFQDRDGHLWFGSYGAGLSRYDGEKFVTFTTDDSLAHNNINAICQDREGIIYFGTYGGVTRYDGHSFTRYTDYPLALFRVGDITDWPGFLSKLNSAGKSAQPSPGKRIWELLSQDIQAVVEESINLQEEQKSNIINALNSNVLENSNFYQERNFSGITIPQEAQRLLNNLVNLSPSEVQRLNRLLIESAYPHEIAKSHSLLSRIPVFSIIQDRNGFFWFATSNGLIRYDGKNYTHYTTEHGLASNNVKIIFEDREGNLYFGTEDAGVSRYDGSHFRNFTVDDGLASNKITSIFQDRSGNLWFGTATDGVKGSEVSRYDGNVFTTLTGLADNMSLGRNIVQAITQDQEGNLWFGTWFGGVSRYDGQKTTTITTHHGLINNNVHTALQDREGYLWFGTSGGVSRYDQNTFVHYGIENSLISNQVSGILQNREGHFWFGTNDGATRFDGKTWASYTTENGLANNPIRCIYEDRDGVVWFGHEDEVISRFDGKKISTFQTGQPHNNHVVNTIIQDQQGYLYFGTEGGGVKRFDGKTFTTFTTQDGLANDIVYWSIEDPEKRIWFGTANGLSLVEGSSFHTYSKAAGLLHTYVRSACFDNDGNFWIGTRNFGVTRYNNTTFDSFTHFSAQDGLTHNWMNDIMQDSKGIMWFCSPDGITRYDGQVFQKLFQQDGLSHSAVGGIIEDREGQIWISTNKGVTRYRRPTPIPPSIVMDAVTTDRRYEKTHDIKMPSTENLISFEFHGVSIKTRPGALIYRYRLKGYEETWRTTQERRVEYLDLLPGNYTFEVQAVDRDLVYSENPATVALTVHVPYERYGLISALGIAIGLVVWQTRRVLRRDRQLRITNRELQQQTQAAQAANVAKSRFLANMSHEIRTPMNAILGYAQILQRKASLAPNDRQAVQTIHRSGDHLLKLINDILDISKIEAGTLELKPMDFDLKALLNDLDVMFRLRCEQKRLQWTLDIPQEDHLYVHGDSAKLSQVLINLLGNAVKFTDSGSVTICVSHKTEELGSTRDHKAPSPLSSQEGGWGVGSFLFQVIDTGPGISPEAQQSIFEPFQQAEAGLQKGGTGLGLSISQRLLNLMDSHLKLISPFSSQSPSNHPFHTLPSSQEGGRGVGACFSFTLSLPPSKITTITTPNYDQWSNVTHLSESHVVHALIADDIAENRDVLSTILFDIGVKTTCVENGQQAFDMIQHQGFDIVFLDIHMPVLNGPDAAQKIWNKMGDRSPKIVAVSASAMEHEQQQYLDMGFHAFISKPFRAEHIFQCLSEQLGVEFERAEQVVAQEIPVDLSTLHLSQTVLDALKETAELANVTELERLLDNLEKQNPEASAFAAHLRGLSQDFKMDDILQILANLRS